MSADPAGAAVDYYVHTFGDRSLDGPIRKMVADMPPEENGELVMTFPEDRRMVRGGVGKRADMIWWGILVDAKAGRAKGVQEPSTASLALAYHVTGDTDFARRALPTTLSMALWRPMSSITRSGTAPSRLSAAVWTPRVVG